MDPNWAVIDNPKSRSSSLLFLLASPTSSSPTYIFYIATEVLKKYYRNKPIVISLSPYYWHA